MKLYPEELAAIHWVQSEDFAQLEPLALSTEQKKRVQQQVVRWQEFERKNPYLHAALIFLPILLNLACIGLTLLWLAPILARERFSEFARAGLLGTLLGFFQYSFVIYTLHEGGGHAVFSRSRLGRSFVARACNQLSRLFFADPEFYGANHRLHHTRLGTAADATNTHFILPYRLLKSILPGAGILFPNDFQVHQNPERTPSRRLSEGIGLLVLALMTTALAQSMSLFSALATMLVITPWVGFLLDRLRESLEHNLMPVDPHLGTRELGLTPLALVIGGGPWGQPCHLAHHLAPSLTWYQQLDFHFELKKILTQPQKALVNLVDTKTRESIPQLLFRLLCRNQRTLVRLKRERGKPPRDDRSQD